MQGVALPMDDGDKSGPVASQRRHLNQSAVSQCRVYWVGPAAAALVQTDVWSRGHVAAYLLPEVQYSSTAAAEVMTLLLFFGTLTISILQMRFRGRIAPTCDETPTPCLLRQSSSCA